MSVLCYTCSRTVEDSAALKCKRPYCQGKKEAEKEQKQAQQKKWAEEDERKFDWSGPYNWTVDD